MRGERLTDGWACDSTAGSSPHARGTPDRGSLRARVSRFIPACAGNAEIDRIFWQGDAVHPRMRGERPGLRPSAARVARFIPACAGNATWPRSASAPRTVHPRMRGERWGSFAAGLDAVGSSPHARGTRTLCHDADGLSRFIPACAGNASTARIVAMALAVHPRMRGERRQGLYSNKTPVRFIPACAGNAGNTLAGTTIVTVHPRMRGERAIRQDSRRISTRFIPACAGNAPSFLYTSARVTVHPRMRGERHLNTTGIGRANGSSPHARGTRILRGAVDQHHRFIPACAGNACHPRCSWTMMAVHPRMRGERASQSPFHRLRTGSSPHARGTHTAGLHTLFQTRFIPACAGNAWWKLARGLPVAVHPRMRGERTFEFEPLITPAGSSPHARGTRGVGRLGVDHVRFIPACAGNAPLPECSLWRWPVHPRMRGERDRRSIASSTTLGSSPHARGTRPTVEHDTTRNRFIPACAGNAASRSPGSGQETVHPRMRGERFSRSRVMASMDGSSPHARGTHH